MMPNTDSTTALLSRHPSWAKALIVAQYVEDASDLMTDYFNTTTKRIVALAWSKHQKDLFSEMRQAAARFPETAHLGPGCDVYTVRVVLTSDVISNGGAYYKGSPSHWHSELADRHGHTFTTRTDAEAFIATAPAPHPIIFDSGTPNETTATFAYHIGVESIEHREKYSMGHGYYLKASGVYSSGWEVKKVSIDGAANYYRGVEVGLLDPAAGAAPAAPAGGVTVPTVSFNTDKNGVELRFPDKPADAVRDDLKRHGWRWSRFSSCWYHRDTPDNRAYADALLVTLTGDRDAE